MMYSTNEPAQSWIQSGLAVALAGPGGCSAKRFHIIGGALCAEHETTVGKLRRNAIYLNDAKSR
jgi:hypothetical protein